MLHRCEVVIDGRRLEVVEHQPPGVLDRQSPRGLDPAILMLHEGLGSVSMWKSFPAAVAARTQRRVIVYSRYGHGESDLLAAARDVDYMHHEGEVVLPQLIEQLALDRPILLGHSDGASIALLCAAARPDLVAALVLEAPHVFVEDRTMAGIEAARLAYARTELPRRLGRYHRDVERTFRGWNDIWLDPRFRNWNIESYLARVRCPVLLIQGENDEYGTAAQLEAIAAKISDTAVVLLANCGHAPHREQPIAALDAIDRFLTRTDLSPAASSDERISAK